MGTVPAPLPAVFLLVAPACGARSLSPCQWGTIGEAPVFAPARRRWARRAAGAGVPAGRQVGYCPAEAGEVLACSLPRGARAESCSQAAVPCPQQMGHLCIPVRWPRVAKCGARSCALTSERGDGQC